MPPPGGVHDHVVRPVVSLARSGQERTDSSEMKSRASCLLEPGPSTPNDRSAWPPTGRWSGWHAPGSTVLATVNSLAIRRGSKKSHADLAHIMSGQPSRPDTPPKDAPDGRQKPGADLQNRRFACLTPLVQAHLMWRDWAVARSGRLTQSRPPGSRLRHPTVRPGVARGPGRPRTQGAPATPRLLLGAPRASR